VIERRVVDEPRRVQVDGEERRPVARVDQVDAEEEPPPADLADDRRATDGRLQLVAERGPALADPVDEAPLDHQVEDRETDRGRQRGAVPRVSEVELPRPLIDGVEDVLPAEHGAERRVAGAEPLADRDDVGLDRELVGREPGPDRPTP
jgi:hypothetical protein